MNLERASQWAEVIGALTVVLGLIFVGLEIRQNTKTQQLTTTQALISDYNHSLATFSDPAMSCFFMQGGSDWRGLTPVEKFRFSTMMLPILFRVGVGPTAIDRIVAINILGTKTAVLLVIIGMIFGSVYKTIR